MRIHFRNKSYSKLMIKCAKISILLIKNYFLLLYEENLLKKECLKAQFPPSCQIY
jgi:hypothetical protein